MSKTYEIAFQIAGKLNASLGNSINDANGKFGKLQERIGKLQTLVGKTEQFEKLENTLKNSGAQYSLLRGEVDRLSEEHAKAASHTNALQNKFISTQNSIERYKNSLLTNRIELRNTSTEIRRLNTEMKSAQGPTAELKAEHDALTQKAAGLRKAIDSDTIAMNSAKNSLKPLSAELKTAKLESTTLATQLKRAERSTAEFQQTTIKQKTTLQALQSTLKASGSNTDEFRRKQEMLARQLKNSEKAMRQYQKIQGMQDKIGALKSSALGTMIGAGEAGAVLSVPIKQAMDMESAMADVKKVINDAPNEYFTQMEADIIGLSKVIPMAAEDLTKIVAAGGQSGIVKEDLLSFAESAAKMGVAFDITAEEAGQKMAVWRTSFRLTQSEVVSLADQVNYLGNSSPVTAAKISEIVSRVGSLGGLAGMSAGEVAALGASLPHVEPEVAATGLKKLFTTLTAGEAATKDQTIAMAELGLNTVDMAKLMQTDAQQGVTSFLKAIQKMPKEKQLSYLKRILGEEGLSALGPAVENVDLLQKNLNAVADKSKYADSMQKEFAARIETTEAQLQLAKNAVDALGMKIGNMLLPWISKGANEFAWIADQVSKFADAFPNLTSFLATAAGGITGITLGASALSYILLGVGYPIMKICGLMAKWGMLTKLQTARTKLLAAAQRIWNLAMSANPIGLVIMGITALCAAGYVLYKNWDTVKEFFIALWESPAANLLFFITGPVGWIIGAVVGIIANWDKVKQWFITLWENPGLALDQFVQMLYDKFGGVVKWLGEKWDWLTGLFSTPIEAKVEASASGKEQAQNYNGEPKQKLARGGIFDKGAFVTSFAEESPEAAIPLDGSPRAIGLWQQAGEMLGMNPARGGGSIAATFAPQIHIAGNADAAAVQQIQQVLQDSLADFERKLNALQNQKARVSYG